MPLHHRLASSVFAREVLRAPLEPLLQDSLFRIRFFTVALILGEPLYWYIWSAVYPQPAESTWLRASAAVAAVPFLFPQVHRYWGKRNLARCWMALTFWTLPYSFFCLYAMNGFNEVWTASCVAMLYILFALTDWRLALAEVVLAVPLVALTAAAGWLPGVPGRPHLPSGPDFAILGFALATAALLGMSAANLRRERARSALVTMGVLAHEFRTPLAAADLLVQALEDEAGTRTPAALPYLAKLRALFTSMNAQIDYQMQSARLMNLPRERVPADMGHLVEAAVQAFPAPGNAIAVVARLSVQRGLVCLVHPEVMCHVVHNLLSNASKALGRKQGSPQPGDIAITVERHGRGKVRIAVADRGDGVPPHMLGRIFEPFETSSHMPSHGLGLTMCRAAVASFGGEIRCESRPGEGATFIVELPEAIPV
jgi:two-component system, CAI-1 autoinducer sensor kinase/phosphatase CqsS